MANISIGGRLSLLQRVASLDLRYGPYSSITDAYENMGPSGDEVITAGLPFGITEDDGSVSVYIWTKGEDATQNDCRKLDKEHIILFNGFIDISVSIKQQSYNDVATKDNIVFINDRKQFAYRDGLNFYINWKNRYVWSNENLIPYDDVIYIDINDNKAYYYNGTTLTLLVSEAFVSSINNQAPDENGNVNITKENIGLGNVDNTADEDKIVKGASEDGSGNVIATTYETKIDATTKQTALQEAIANLTGLDSTNFGGFSIQSTEADAINNIATLYTADGFTDELRWYLAGTSLNSVKAYRYNGNDTPSLISSNEYDCLDFSGLITDVSNLTANLAELRLEIGNKEAVYDSTILTRNGYIDLSGVYHSNDSYRTSTKIALAKGLKILVHSVTPSTSATICAVYEKDGSVLYVMTPDHSGTPFINYEYTAPKDVDIVVSCHSSETNLASFSFKIYHYGLVKDVDELQQLVPKVQQNSDAIGETSSSSDSSILTRNGYFDENGGYHAHNSYRASTKINVKAGNKITVRAAVTGAAYCLVVFSTDGQLLNVWSPSNTKTYEAHSYTPNVDAEVYVCTGSSYTAGFSMTLSGYGLKGSVQNNARIEAFVNNAEKYNKGAVLPNYPSDAASAFMSAVKELHYSYKGNSNPVYIRLFGFYTNKIQLTISEDKSTFIDLVEEENLSTSGVQTYIFIKDDRYIKMTIDWDAWNTTTFSDSNSNIEVLNTIHQSINDIKVELALTRLDGINAHGPIMCFIDDDSGQYVPNIWGEIVESTGIRFGIACIAGFMSGERTTSDPRYQQMSLNELRTLYNEGHEVYSHSWSHPSFVNSNIDTINEQCWKSRIWMLNNGFTKNADIIVYPGGMDATTRAEKTAVVRRHYRYGVTTSYRDVGINYEPLEELFISRCNADSNNLEYLKGKVDDCVAQNKMLVVLTHAYELMGLGSTSLSSDRDVNVQRIIDLIEYAQGQGVTILPLGEAIHEIYGW